MKEIKVTHPLNPSILRWFKSFAIFFNDRFKSAGPDNFAAIMKVTSYFKLWDAVFTLYSLSVTLLICLNGLEHGLGINGFKPIWLDQMVKVFATQTKFREPYCYCTGINWAFTVCKHMFWVPWRDDPVRI